MEKLRDLIINNEDWLINRVVAYAKEHGYTEFTSTLKEAWRVSICGLSEPLLAALEIFEEPPAFSANDNFARNPIAAFGIEQAKQHRARGVTLTLFLGLTKYYRQAYVDLIMAQDFPARMQERYRSFIERFFDLVELGFCTEWSNATENVKLAETQERNRSITNEKNKYLTIFESLNDPVVLIDDKGVIQNLNHAAHALFIGPKDPGAMYYGTGEQIFLKEQIEILTSSDGASDCFEATLETKNGTRNFDVRIQRMLDISEKFLGTVVILNDITEHKRTEELAEIANKAKSAFLATMSHEIRTPINGVLGMANLLKDTPLSEAQKHYLNGITTSGEVLMTTLNDILDYSKIEAGMLELETVDFDLHKIITQVAELIEPTTAEKGTRFSISIDDNVPSYLRGDPGKVRQVLLNLASNAVKFTPSGSVAIHVCRSGAEIRNVEGLRFDITDTGIGISVEKVEDLFEPFTQQDASISRLYGGTGLGLAICKKLVSAMGGSIGYQVNDKGGSIFSFEIPLYESMAEAVTAERSTPTWSPQPLKVLLVEDNKVNRLVAEGFLQRQGHNVTVAESGEEALNVLADKSFDLIFMDIRMPGMSGLEAVRRIRVSDNSSLARTPIIVLSAHVIRSEVEECFTAGANGFLGKPFMPEDIQDVIMECLSDPADYTRIMNNPEQNTTQQIINPNVIRQHLKLLGPERADRIVTTFVGTTPKVMAALHKELDIEAYDSIADHAHGLKSAAGNVGLNCMMALAKKLEETATDRDKSKSLTTFNELETIYTQSVRALEDAWRETTSERSR